MNEVIEGLLQDAQAETKRRERYWEEHSKAHELITIDGTRIDKIGRDYIATIPIKEGRVVITFSEIIRSRQSFETVLSITMYHNTEGEMPSFEQRIDLNSQNALATLATSLNKAYGKQHNWVLMLNKGGNALKRLVAQEKQPLHAMDQMKPVDFLLHPFLQRGASNMIYADSEVGKSFFSLYLASVAACGGKFINYPTKPFRTLYLDYEDDYDTFSYRMHTICKGNNLDFEKVKNSVLYHKPDGDMVDEAEIVARMVDSGKFDLIIIDAGSSATGGDPLNSTPVIKLFDALEKIPCTKLIIHHEGKVTDGKTDGQALYGTTFWKARLRVGWRLSLLEQVDTENGNEKVIKVSMFKGSNLPKQQSFIYKTSFTNNGVQFASVSEFEEPRETKIMNFLIAAPESTFASIADGTGISRTTVQRVMQDLLERDLVIFTKKGGKTGSLLWSKSDRS